VLHLRVFGSAYAMAEVAETLSGLQHLGVAADDVSLLRIDAIQPLLRHPRGASIYDNEILIVGAMAVSPDLLPITSICVGAVLRRGVLVLRAVWTLAAGLACVCLFAGGLTAVLDLADLLPSGFAVGEGALSGLTTVNSSTFVVALAAGAAGMLALRTRASSAVGVAISVTTIPASAYLGVAAGVGEVAKAAGAAAVLGINVTMLTLGGTATLLAQRRLARRGAGEAARP